MSPQVKEIMSKISALNYFSLLNDDQKYMKSGPATAHGIKP